MVLRCGSSKVITYTKTGGIGKVLECPVKMQFSAVTLSDKVAGFGSAPEQRMF